MFDRTETSMPICRLKRSFDFLYALPSGAHDSVRNLTWQKSAQRRLGSKMDRRISLLVLFIAAAGASPVVAPAVSHADTTLVLFEHDTVQHQLDLGATGPSALDQFIFAGDVFDRPGGVFLGTAGGSCTTLSGTQSACNATFSLAGGQIVVQGVADSAALFEA